MQTQRESKTSEYIQKLQSMYMQTSSLSGHHHHSHIRLHYIPTVHLSKEPTVRHGTKDANHNTRHQKCTHQTLNEDGILNLSQRRLLDPNFTVKDFADNVAFLVLGDPRLIFIAGRGWWTEQRILGAGLYGCVLGVGEEFPRAEMAVVHPVQDYTHSLPCGDQCRDAENQANDWQDTPCTAGRTQRDEQVCKDAEKD